METCQECGEEFAPVNTNHTKYCSKRCKNRVMGRRAYQRHQAGSLGSCSVEGCTKNIRCRGLCTMHYYRLLRTGDVGEAQSQRRGARPCKVDTCDNRAVTSDDLCPTHRRRKHLYGTPDGSFSTTKVCALCGAPAVPAGKSSEYCRSHYVAFVHAEVVAGRIEGQVNPSNGYVYVSVFKKRRAAHQIVMEHKLGRPLRPFENVHHINGRRADNRPENLELWTKAQPCGQRPEDLVAWVVENYPELIPTKEHSA